MNNEEFIDYIQAELMKRGFIYVTIEKERYFCQNGGVTTLDEIEVTIRGRINSKDILFSKKAPIPPKVRIIKEGKDPEKK